MISAFLPLFCHFSNCLLLLIFKSSMKLLFCCSAFDILLLSFAVVLLSCYFPLLFCVLFCSFFFPFSPSKRYFLIYSPMTLFAVKFSRIHFSIHLRVFSYLRVFIQCQSPSVCLLVCRTVYLSVCIPACLSVCVLVHLLVCL